MSVVPYLGWLFAFLLAAFGGSCLVFAALLAKALINNA
jgi:hypothetical protein